MKCFKKEKEFQFKNPTRLMYLSLCPRNRTLYEHTFPSFYDNLKQDVKRTTKSYSELWKTYYLLNWNRFFYRLVEKKKGKRESKTLHQRFGNLTGQTILTEKLTRMFTKKTELGFSLFNLKRKDTLTKVKCKWLNDIHDSIWPLSSKPNYVQDSHYNVIQLL